MLHRIVVVGASLAGLRAAETLRDRGFDGALTLIGEEPHRPYDRPPLSFATHMRARDQRTELALGCPWSRLATSSSRDAH